MGEEFVEYVARVSEFTPRDWRVYLSWVGLMVGLCLSSSGFLLFGSAHGVVFPGSAWLVPAGAIIFSIAIAIDTIGHLTIYREVLEKAERLVHHVTIFCGVFACVLLCAAYQARIPFGIPALIFTLLSFLYSLIDEAFHWKRYESRHADRVEMWSHVFILLGHGIMMGGWWAWFVSGYGGVAATVAHWGHA